MRQVRRNRLSESDQGGIDTDYMQLLDAAHERMVAAFEAREGTRLLRLACWEKELSDQAVDSILCELVPSLFSGQ